MSNTKTKYGIYFEKIATIYACYLNSFVTLQNKKWKIDYIKPSGRTKLIHHKYDIIWRTTEQNIASTQLCLIPISSITSEQAHQICRILNLQYSDTDESFFFDLNGLKDYLIQQFNGYNRFEDKYDFQTILRLIDYCRSESIDIGYGSIPSLIKADMAVDVSVAMEEPTQGISDSISH